MFKGSVTLKPVAVNDGVHDGYLPITLATCQLVKHSASIKKQITYLLIRARSLFVLYEHNQHSQSSQQIFIER